MACYEDFDKSCEDKVTSEVQVHVGAGAADSAEQPGGPGAEGAGEERPAATEPKRFSAVEGLVFPNMTARDCFHPGVVLYTLFYVFSCMQGPLLPFSFYADKEPPPIVLQPGRYTMEGRFRFGVAIAEVTLAYQVGMLGVASLRAIVLHAGITCVALAAATYLMADTVIAYTLCCITVPLWSLGGHLKQLRFVVAMLTALLPMLFAYIEIIFLLPDLTALIRSSAVAALILPAVGSIVSLVACSVIVPIVRRFGRAGLPACTCSFLLAVVMGLGDVLRLAGMTLDVDSVASVACAALMSIFSDLWLRTCAGSVLLARLRGQTLALPPETDLILRLRFSSSYVPVSIFFWLVVAAAAAGAPWARKATPWIGLLAYAASCALCDLVVTASHRLLAPVERERFWATVWRLSSEPRAHWPWLQPEVPTTQEELWAPSSVASALSYVRDEWISVVCAVQLMGTWSTALIFAFQGPCGYKIHMERCIRDDLLQ